MQALQGEPQQAEAALRDQLAHEASTAGLQARLEAAEAAEQEERARETAAGAVASRRNQRASAQGGVRRLVQVEHDRDREREALTRPSKSLSKDWAPALYGDHRFGCRPERPI